MEDKKILVVDDEDMIRELMDKVLKKANYTVRLAESAEQAIGILRKESIMVIFIDLFLPNMNGIELCKRLRKDNPIGIFYALTGYADLFGLLECRKAGFDDFFTKPFKVLEIIEAAEHAFNALERWKVKEYNLG